MANVIQRKVDTEATFTLTLASLANLAGRQSTMIANPNNRPGAKIYLKISSGASAPTADTPYEVYLIQAEKHTSPNYRSDGAGASDAAWTPQNAKLLGAIIVTANANTAFYGEFDTSSVVACLGPSWGIGIYNRSGQALHSTEGNHYKGYSTYYDEIQ